MARSPYSLYKRRGSRQCKYVYYVQFRDPLTHRFATGRSVGRLADILGISTVEWPPSSKAGARYIADAWLAGKSTRPLPSEPLLGEFCLNFWDWDASEYVKTLRASKRGIGKGYVTTNYSYISRFLMPNTIAKVPIGSVSAVSLEHFLMELRDSHSLANKSCNEVLGAILKPLNEAARLGTIKESPAGRVRRLDRDTKTKGVLTSDEVKRLFSLPWDEEWSRIAAQVSLSCGLRLGEVLAIRTASIGDQTLMVDASYSKTDGLKSTKNRQSRVVYLPGHIRTSLLDLIARNPFKEDYAFWGKTPGKPIWDTTLANAFIAQLEKIGIKNIPLSKGESPVPGSRQARNISFHSLRHLYNTFLRGSIPDALLRETTGHLTASMTDHYDHPEHDLRISETAAAVESRIMPLLKMVP